MCEQWYERFALVHRRRPEIAQQSINRDIVSTIGNIKIDSLSTAHIFQCVDPIIARGSKIQANKTLRLLKQIFRWAYVRDLLSTPIGDKINSQDVGGRETPRERAFSNEEISIFWNNIEKTDISAQFQIALKILLVTGQRVNEIRLAKWQDLNLQKSIWNIPANNNKSSRDHWVYLSPLAIQLFRELKLICMDSEFVMPSPTNNTKIIADKSIARATNRHQHEIGLKKWTPHDLRRSFATGVNKLQPNIHVTEKILNHQLEGMLRVYDVGDYTEQRIQTMNIWAEHIEKLCNLPRLSRAA